MKQLNTYINEGLFDNIGIGPEHQIEEWLNLNIQDVYRVNTNEEFKDYSITGGKIKNPDFIYKINQKDLSIDIKCFNRSFFPIKNNDTITFPKFIKLNKAYVDPLYSSADYFTLFENVNAENWNEFIPKKISGIQKAHEVWFQNSNITDGVIENILEKNIKPYRLDEIYISHCPNITKLDFSKIDFKSPIDPLSLKFNLEFNKNLQSIDLNISTYNSVLLYINNCPKLDISKCNMKFNLYFKNLCIDITNTQIEKEILKKLNKDPKNFDCDVVQQIKQMYTGTGYIILCSTKIKHELMNDNVLIQKRRL